MATALSLECDRPAERRREDAKGGSAPPPPPQQGSPPPCKAKFPLETKNWDKNIQGFHKWQRFTSIC